MFWAERKLINPGAVLRGAVEDWPNPSQTLNNRYVLMKQNLCNRQSLCIYPSRGSFVWENSRRISKHFKDIVSGTYFVLRYFVTCAIQNFGDFNLDYTVFQLEEISLVVSSLLKKKKLK